MWILPLFSNPMLLRYHQAETFRNISPEAGKTQRPKRTGHVRLANAHSVRPAFDCVAMARDPTPATHGVAEKAPHAADPDDARENNRVAGAESTSLHGS